MRPLLRLSPWLLASASSAWPLAGCVSRIEPCAGRAVSPGESFDCPAPGWVDRAFSVSVPAKWNGAAQLPTIIAFHGGGGNRRAAESVTCPDGDTSSPGCFTRAANDRGFAVVRPDGTGSRPLRNIRTWNSGGGTGGFGCTSGNACKSGVDDVAYFDALLGEIARVFPVDPQRVFLTGLSNGGAISHRLACERGDRIAAIAPVGGANQFAAVGGACATPVPILHVHGTEDPCWGYVESDTSCLVENGVKAGIARSMEGWRLRNGCAEKPEETQLPDRDSQDGTRVVRVKYTGCKADTEHLRVEGGGHTWPSGNQYFGTSIIGRVTRDIGSDEILEFFLAHPRK